MPFRMNIIDRREESGGGGLDLDWRLLQWVNVMLKRGFEGMAWTGSDSNEKGDGCGKGCVGRGGMAPDEEE